MRWTVVAACALTLVPYPLGVARANGRYPRAGQLIAAPNDPKTLVARATFGVLVSRDRGASWDWVCENGIGYTGTEDPFLAMTSRGTLLAALREGIARSTDGACNWAFATTQSTIDLAVRGDSIVALASSPSGARLLVSTDDGATFGPFGTPIDRAIQVETVDLAPSDPHRVYVSGFRYVDGGVAGVLLESTDDAVTWRERPLALDSAREHAPFIAAVDPKNADRLYVRTNPISKSRLLVSNDAGGTFTEVYSSTSDLAGFALAPDGTRVYAGSTTGGLVAANASDLHFSPIASADVSCLTATASSVFVCASETSGFFVGELDPRTDQIAPRLHLWGVRGPLACSASSSAATCAAQWPALASQLAASAPMPDASTADAAPLPAPTASSPARAAPTASPSSSSGCSSTPEPSSAAWALATVAIAAVGAAARRARKR